MVGQVNNLSMLNPEIVTAIGLMLLFSSLNIKTGFITLLLSHIIFCMFYVMLSVTPKLRQLDDNLAEAALDLGCSPFQALYMSVIPQILPGIISGALIAFMMSFDDFVISYFVTWTKVNNISTKKTCQVLNALIQVLMPLVAL